MKQNVKIINKTFFKADDYVINVNHICSIKPSTTHDGHALLYMVCGGPDHSIMVHATVDDLNGILYEMGTL